MADLWFGTLMADFSIWTLMADLWFWTPVADFLFWSQWPIWTLKVADLDPESGRFVILATRGRFAIWDTWGWFVNYSGPLTLFSDSAHWWLIFHLLDLNGWLVSFDTSGPFVILDFSCRFVIQDTSGPFVILNFSGLLFNLDPCGRFLILVPIVADLWFKP